VRPQPDPHGNAAYSVFFAVAPGGLCYCLGERQSWLR